jgi:hypothetical protein
MPIDGPIDRALVLDGNAVAGLLQEIFAVEMTVCPAECVGCGREGALATLLAYTRSSGVVLRCPGCGAVVLRVVQTPRAAYLDARGAKYLRLERRSV